MHHFRTAIKYGLYPFSLISTGIICWLTFTQQYNIAAAYTWIAAIRFTFLQGVELAVPLRTDWGINLKEFWRDIKYGAVNFLTLRLYGFLIGLGTISFAIDNPGLIAGAPLWLDIIATALMYEFFQYWFHRISHEGSGWIGKKLWHIHVAHHLPDRVYLIMHAVGHPINFLVVMWFVPLATWLTGASAEAVMVWFAFRGLHGLLSHFNVDIRAGWLNYIFVGTELHRYHHSASLEDSKNYGSLLPFWDQLFGTFVYKPGVNPVRLGVEDPSKYPKTHDAMQVLALPFKPSRNSRPEAQVSET